MSRNWEMFFAPGSRVVALPGWRRPRLYVPTRPFLKVWSRSQLYPASLTRAKLYRAALRVAAATGVRYGRVVTCKDWLLSEFVRDSLPNFESAVVLVGTPGPAQKMVARLQDSKGRTIGYLKYAEKVRARQRLRREKAILDGLPPGAGPKMLHFGTLGNGEAMLCSPVEGDPLPPKASPPRELVTYLSHLRVSEDRFPERHPGIVRLTGGEVDGYLEVIAEREWPVVIGHGDLAPWNVIRSPEGAIAAIDWEYGDFEGLPYLDLAYFILQTFALIHRRSPVEALWYTVGYLLSVSGHELGISQAEAFTRISAYDAFSRSREDGQSDDEYLQRWRRGVWEAKAWHV